jgi:hypothetical protein
VIFALTWKKKREKNVHAMLATHGERKFKYKHGKPMVSQEE